MEVKIKLLDKGLPLPRYQHPREDAGLDLMSRIDLELEPGERKLVPTGIALAIPAGFVGYVNPRSGLALKHGVTVLNADGVIDPGYRGEVGVILINHGSQTFSVKRGDRIAQLILHSYSPVSWQEVEELPASCREEKGFGDTGK